MAGLYEIEQSIMDCVDMETGEIVDPVRLGELQLERKTKIRNIACWIKNLRSDAASYEAEEKSFRQRKEAAARKAYNLARYLDSVLKGEAVKDIEFAVTYKRSEAVEVDDDSIEGLPEEFKIIPPARANKTALKKAIKEGAAFNGVKLVERNNMQIK